MNIQWYPGHMTKARRAMEEDLKLVDLIIELVDARIPRSSRNPDIHRLGKQKKRLIILCKADLADETACRRWKAYFEAEGCMALALDARKNASKPVKDAIQKCCKEKMARDRQRGILNRPLRVMVVGIPNVGKSTFINSLAGRAVTKTGNKPGVTRGNQWIRLSGSTELLDTPGILWPKFDDPMVGIRLALTGSINDEILNISELALEGIRLMQELYPDSLCLRYGEVENMTPAQVLEQIATIRGCLKKGGVLDYDKAARLFLDELRSSKLGRFTLEWPEKKPAEEG